MNDEQLIELIRQYPALYDLSDRKYMDSNYKIIVWNKIGTCMKEDVSVCKARWNNIRDNYRRSLKKIMTRSGQGKKRIKVYKYSEQLSFLKQHFDQRETKDNIESQEKDQNLTQEERDIPEENKVEESQEENEYVVQNEKVEPNVALHVNDDSQSNANCTSDTLEMSRKSIKRKAKTRNEVAPQQTVSSKLIDYLIKQNQNNTPQHPVDAFLAGIAPTLKTLPPYYLHLAKSEIFSTVQKYEMKMLKKHHFYQDSSQHSPHTSDSSSQNTPLPSPTGAVLHHENTTAAFENHPNTSMY